MDQRKIFENWVNEYENELYSWAFYKTSEREVSEDLVQDTFLSAYRSYNSFKGNSSPKTWLFKILNNKIIDYYRKSAHSIFKNKDPSQNLAFQTTNSLFDNNGNWELNGYENLWDENEHLLDNEAFNKVMDTCMDDLPINWKTAVLMKYRLEKGYKEICQELKVSSSNYWQIIHRAKLFLKKCIEKYWFDKM
ncbi:sigma-70 family RNA polymerase sigma factor [Echinicola jeungdonensis]|uniref:RNA polymerase sigma factor n=1 Tax=Echinicola jeungdonensis TaxID=709343 RepID=A0ABV5J4I7_9BACT|nr:sigma-70 family RNA polymerase sigma factor [Echinicola jeungdonensis]MDN3669041.1 sigma-70 family RNA polymerase sigma factor [Echinicola jeungdonensis]